MPSARHHQNRKDEGGNHFPHVAQVRGIAGADPRRVDSPRHPRSANRRRVDSSRPPWSAKCGRVDSSRPPRSAKYGRVDSPERKSASSGFAIRPLEPLLRSQSSTRGTFALRPPCQSSTRGTFALRPLGQSSTRGTFALQHIDRIPESLDGNLRR